MSSTAEKANLARIRDNQRRSRARRKEYLQELESRLRQCELEGIEASAEIQIAARRVANENKKLRALLRQHGVGDERIEAWVLREPAGVDTTSTGGGLDLAATNCGITGTGGGSASGAVQVLEQLLNTKKTCCADEGSIMTTSICTNTGSRNSSTESMTTVQSLWNPAFNNDTQGRHASEKTRISEQYHHPFITPSASASRKSSTSIVPRLLPQHQRTMSIPPSMGTIGSSTAVDEILGDQGQHMFDFDEQLLGLDHQMYQHISPAPPLSQQQQQQHHHHHQHQHSRQNHNLSHNQQPREVLQMPYNQLAQVEPITTQHMDHCQTQSQSSSQYLPPGTDGAIGSNSCVFATNMITTVSGGDPNEVLAQLGCGPGAMSGMDCQVDNRVVFNVMDRFSGHHV